MPATTTMTLEEFLALPERNDGVYYELREGELVEWTRPKKLHSRIQARLADLLAVVGKRFGRVTIELPFQPTPDSFMAADVAFVISGRWAKEEDYLQGSPELVIEVLSPSNTFHEIDQKEALCIRTGCREFWVVDSVNCTVRVTTGPSYKRYAIEDTIPCSVLP